MIKSDSEFLQFALSKYDNPQLSSLSEFESDLKRFASISILLNRYVDNVTELPYRLIVNHLIILSNCFTQSGVINMINFKFSGENRKTLDTFLYYLGFISETHYGLNFYLLDMLNE
jgi:hypothetical protein